jgi:hypothetical protein
MMKLSELRISIERVEKAHPEVYLPEVRTQPSGTEVTVAAATPNALLQPA